MIWFFSARIESAHALLNITLKLHIYDKNISDYG